MRRQSERGRNSSSKRTNKRWTGLPDPSTSDSPHGTKGLRPARTLARAGEVRGIPKYPKACAIALFRPSSSSPGHFAQGKLIRQCGTQHGQPSHAMNQTLPCNPDPSIVFRQGCVGLPLTRWPVAASSPHHETSSFSQCLGRHRSSHPARRGPSLPAPTDNFPVCEPSCRAPPPSSLYIPYVRGQTGKSPLMSPIGSWSIDSTHETKIGRH